MRHDINQFSADELSKLVEKFAAYCLANNIKVVTAESCTGGGLAAAFTDLAGSSDWFERGYVTYSNLAKQQCLGVSEQTLLKHGAVSEQTAAEMALGALQNSAANIAISITGIAGPAGGTTEKPVGTVCFGWAGEMFEPGCEVSTKLFEGDRAEVRLQSCLFAIDKAIIV